MAPDVMSKIPAVNESTYTVRVPGIKRVFEFTYHTGFLPFLVLVGRVLFGFFFIWSGLAKVIHNGDWMGIQWFKGSPEAP